MFDGIVNILVSIYDFIYDFGMTCINILSYIVSIFGFIWYGGKTLVIGLFKILRNIFDGGVFDKVNNAFVSISNYIGGSATIIIASLLFMIIIRILVSFVFKLLRLNIDYHPFNSKRKSLNQSDFIEKYK